MKPEDFKTFQSLLKEVSGLIIGEDKSYLLESRLKFILKKYELQDMSQIADGVRKDKSSKIAWDVVEAMTTNETSFFRDLNPFEVFKNYTIPELMKTKGTNKTIRILSAACSSGQEPYSLAMIIKEQGWENQGWRFEIVGIDISHEILDTAKSAIYSQFEVQRGLPIMMLVKYFTQVNEKWHLNDTIKRAVTFKHYNLLKPSYTDLGNFDIVFCRNVLIYFDNETKGQVLERLSKITNPNGFLVLGGAETILGRTEKYVSVKDQRGLFALNSATKEAEKRMPDSSLASSTKL